MAIPNITESDIMQALAYIDENGVPNKNESTRYELVLSNGKKYPPKYVIAVAEHIAHGTDISTDSYNAVDAKNFLSGKGFTIETKQEKFQLIITKNQVVSTDERFTMNSLDLGDNYKPLDAYFKNKDGEIIRRNYEKGEKKFPI